MMVLTSICALYSWPERQSCKHFLLVFVFSFRFFSAGLSALSTLSELLNLQALCCSQTLHVCVPLA